MIIKFENFGYYITLHIMEEACMIIGWVNNFNKTFWPWLALGGRIYSLSIKVFGCLHQQTNNFVHRCVNMELWAKDIDGLPLVVLHAIEGVDSFCRELKWLLFLKHIVVVGESSFKLVVFSGFSSFLFFSYASCDWWGFKTWLVPLPLRDPLWVLLC